MATFQVLFQLGRAKDLLAPLYLAVQEIPHTHGGHNPHISVPVRTFHTLWDCLISLVRHTSAFNYRQKSLQNPQRVMLRQ